MKKNVIFIVVDSFMYDKVGMQEYGTTTTPFLDSIKKDCISTTNLYSQGPFTEAAIMALLSGNDSLNEGGYMHNLNTKENHFIDVFYKSGYEIFNIFYPYFMYSKDILDKIKYQYFNCDFIFNSVFSNRLSYFHELSLTRELNKNEINDIKKQLEITFDAWDNFFSKSDNGYSHKLLDKVISNYNFKENQLKLIEEKEEYYKNKKEYINNLLIKGTTHSLFTIERIKTSDFPNQNVIKYFYKKYRFFILKIYLLQLYYTLKNSKQIINKFLKELYKLKFNFNYLRSIKISLFMGKLAYKYKNKNFLKYMPSFRRQIELLVDELSTKSSSKKPFFAMLHPLDLHHESSFITYDTDQPEILDEEINFHKKYVSNISSKFKGSIIYDLSTLYIDFCIKNLFIKLRSTNLIKNTIIVITSDHGCSFVNYPMRETFVNNYHSENYKIPLFIYGEDFIPIEVNTYLTNIDVIPTLYDLLGIDQPYNISGKSILKNNLKKSYAISEYMGGGCPDMRLRPINFIIRDTKYLLAYTVRLAENFDNGRIIEVYDLEFDKEENHNIVSIISKDKIDYLLDKLKNRFKEIKNNNPILLS